MGINDRDYARSDQQGGFGPQMRLAMPSLTPAVKWLLIINVVIFVANTMLDPATELHRFGRFFSPYFAVSSTYWWQVWRLVTYQFLHGGPGHIFGNMFGLYIFGSLLERAWGTKKFIKFYLICGAAGGVVYPLLVAVKILNPGILIGASGAVFGLLAAAAILFPKQKLYIMGVFPLSIVALAFIFIAISMLGFLGGENAGGEAAHLAGAATAAVYILWTPWRTKMRAKSSHGRWQQKVDQERNFHVEVDRILAKVHDSGINTLTKKEKQILKQATEIEQSDT